MPNRALGIAENKIIIIFRKRIFLNEKNPKISEKYRKIALFASSRGEPTAPPAPSPPLPTPMLVA